MLQTLLLSSTILLFISQLLDGAASDAEDVELLMLASQWAGAAYVQQVRLIIILKMIIMKVPQVLNQKSFVSYDSFPCYKSMLSSDFPK